MEKRNMSNPAPPEVTMKRTKGEDELNTLSINTIRVLSADIVEKAKSGHPGAPMGCAPIAHSLYTKFMNHSPQNPKWANRDRFVLSNGHGCALLYSMLHLTGYDLSLDDLKSFRQLGSFTPGHPENMVTPGVEVSTGPLGQGISNAVGIAIAEKHLAATFNRDNFNVMDHYTYVICGDGCLQEGISSEACSLAGHLGLGKLIVCYDDNSITIDGDTNVSFTEDVNMRYAAYGWHVQTVSDVNDTAALDQAIHNAKLVTDRPSIIKIKTVIGFGSTKQGTEAVHGAALGANDLAHVKTSFGFDPNETFVIPGEVTAFYSEKMAEKKEVFKAWEAMFGAYATAYPDLAGEVMRRMKGELPSDFVEKMMALNYAPNDGKGDKATRVRSEEVLNAMAVAMPELMGGSADLTGSNLTALKCTSDFQKDTPAGRYVRFGVREHAMAAICVGMFAHGGVRPFGATFLTFIGYALGSVRVSALSELGIIYVMTHDSIGLGEDGPTHQPVETYETLRCLPNLYCFRPADGNETVGAYTRAAQSTKTPSVLCFSRQGVPTLAHSSAANTAFGAYTIFEVNAPPATGFAGSVTPPYPALTIAATGTEVSLAIEVSKALAAASPGSAWVRVVSMPCWELFDKQSREYQDSVFMPGSPVFSIEAAGVHGWKKYAHASWGIPDCYGASAPGGKLMAYFGFTVENLVERAKEVAAFYSVSSTYPTAPPLLHYPRFQMKTNHMLFPTHH